MATIQPLIGLSPIVKRVSFNLDYIGSGRYSMQQTLLVTRNQ